MADKDKTGPYCFPVFQCQDSPGDGQNEAETFEEKIAIVQARGFKEGQCQGRDQALELKKLRIEHLTSLLSETRAALEAHQMKIRTLSEDDSVRLALDFARNIIQCEIDRRPDIVDEILRRTVDIISDRENLKIRVNPADCETMRRLLEEKIPNKEAWRDIHITADAALNRGGSLIETDFGVIDSRIDQQITTIADKLTVDVAESKAALRRDGQMPPSIDNYRQTVKTTIPIRTYGHVTQVVGLIVEANGPMVQLGHMCDIHGNDKDRPVTAEVLGFRDRTVLMMPLEDIRAIGPGSRVVARQDKASVPVGSKLLGRIINGLGKPIDGRGPLGAETSYPIYAVPINPLLRQRIKTPLDMGIRSINGLLTIGCGQRMGVFAGSGVGKSVLMGMIARKSRADVNVIALIGERGRELNDFIEKELGEEGLKKSVVIVATSDHLPLVRVRGAFVATAIAEYFRDQGMTVNLMMDSLTRFAMAQREIGLALGEPPTTKGYTPSVFTLLPKLLERAGTSDHNGSITGLYTVLVEGDDMNEPIADAARSILDGHIVLSRELAHQNHYPAIDILGSISRVMEDIATLQHKHNAGRLKEILATYKKSEDLINIGAYVSGSSAAIDRAVEKIDQINGYLKQDITESVDFEKSLQQLDRIMAT
jgi:flagellum-specific ATP synthase